MTPPNVLGTPKPESSVMISRMLGACLGGTMRGAHHALEFRASFLMTPPNFGSGAGNCRPLMVVVASGAPGVPVVWISVPAAEAVTQEATPSAVEADSTVRPYLIRLLRFMFFVLGCLMNRFDFADGCIARESGCNPP